MPDFEQRPLSGFKHITKDYAEVYDMTVRLWRMVRTYADGRIERYTVALAGADRHTVMTLEPWYCIGCTYGDDGPQCAECHAVARYEQSIGKA